MQTLKCCCVLTFVNTIFIFYVTKHRRYLFVATDEEVTAKFCVECDLEQHHKDTSKEKAMVIINIFVQA